MTTVRKPTHSSKPVTTPDAAPPSAILVVDIGGTKVKVLASGETEPRKMSSGKRLTPRRMVDGVRELAAGWKYEAVSIGFPGLVGNHGPQSEPGNLGTGWVGFDFAAAFEKPVRIMNDAAMQALGSYEGGRMLFLGLGTGLGSALVAEGVLMPLELAHLPYRRGRTFEDYVGMRGFLRLGRRKWTQHVHVVVELLRAGLQADYVVLGGGQSKKLKTVPRSVRLGDNHDAILGGQRLWDAPAHRQRRTLVTGSSHVVVPSPSDRSKPRRRTARAA